jgi:cardiolipin synthase A/B
MTATDTATTTSAPRSPRGGSVDRARTRVSDAPLRHGNRLTVLRNGPEAYDEWISEIERAERWVHLENYLFKGDGVGRRIGAALKAKAREGVPTRVIYDWYGSFNTSAAFWSDLRRAGVDMRAFNPLSLGAPLEVALRDHRKSLVVDGEYASVGGVCIADEWVERSPDTGLPYRDTAIGLRGPAVADVDRAFGQVWARCGEALPVDESTRPEAIPAAGDEAARVVVQEPGRMRIARLLQLTAAGASERLWIADAYFIAGPTLKQALMSAARDGVDVRLLLPATNDVPLVSTISRAGYRELLESGVRIFEYGGLMMHAKTSVADGWSSRVGSTNLNITGLLTDWELDVVVESERFGAEMERMFEDDLADSREMLLGGSARRPRAEPERHIARARRRSAPGPPGTGSSGSGPRALATAARAGGAALRVGGADLERYERTAGAALSGGLLGAAALGARYPRALAWPLASVAGLVGASGLRRVLRRPARSGAAGDSSRAPAGSPAQSDQGGTTMTDETVGAPGGPEGDEAGSGGRSPEEDEGSRQASPHTSAEEGHPAGAGERGDREVGGPTSPDREPEEDATGGGRGTKPSGFEPDG